MVKVYRCGVEGPVLGSDGGCPTVLLRFPAENEITFAFRVRATFVEPAQQHARRDLTQFVAGVGKYESVGAGTPGRGRACRRTNFGPTQHTR